MDLLDGLNEEQHRAVTTTEGPVLVLAGAGSGKTRVITVRIAYLLECGARPESILALTFTNKAAREMRERVKSLVGARRAKRLFVGTFHAFAIALLRQHGKEVGIERFTISDGSDQLSIVRSALREVSVGGTRMQPGAVLSRISLLKSRMSDPRTLQSQAADDRDELVGAVWERYERQLQRSRTLDFDDLLLQALRILRKPGGPGPEISARYGHVMVDEYQDTNGPQYEIVRAVAGAHRNLCVVGDDDQSIYGWRGADVQKILGFERDFREATVIKLETNYRSTAPILQAANQLIRNNPGRHEKALRSWRGEGPPVRFGAVEDETVEAEKIVGEIAGLLKDGRAAPGDFAILFRTGPQARVFEAELRDRGIRYELVGGLSFFDRKEIRDVVAYLKLVVNPEDEVTLLRVIGAPPRGIGRTSVERILDFSTEHGIPFSEAFLRAGEIPALPDATATAAAEFMAQLRDLAGDRGPLAARVERVIDAVGYHREVERLYPDPEVREKRWAAVEEVLNFAENHARRHRGASLATFLQALALEANDDPTPEDDARRDGVTLMTLHAAKGLEYPRVYLVGLEEGLLPHKRAVAEDGVEEERRLAYVGVTRARAQLTLTWAKTRARNGRRVESMPSRFLFEIRDTPPPKGWVAEGDPRPRPKRKARRRAVRIGGRAM